MILETLFCLILKCWHGVLYRRCSERVLCLDSLYRNDCLFLDARALLSIQDIYSLTSFLPEHSHKTGHSIIYWVKIAENSLFLELHYMLIPVTNQVESLEHAADKYFED